MLLRNLSPYLDKIYIECILAIEEQHLILSVHKENKKYVQQPCQKGGEPTEEKLV